MARGKLERTKLKEAVVTAVRETTAYQVAGQVLEQSKRKEQAKKPLIESLREHIGKAIDRIDPIELAVILSGTYIIHETIKTTESLLAKINPVLTKLALNPDWLSTAISLGPPGIVGLPGIFAGTLIGDLLLGLIPQASSTSELDTAPSRVGRVPHGPAPHDPTATSLGQVESILPTQADILLWLVSFVVAYIGIKNAGKIGSSILDITGVLAFLGM